MQTKPKIQIDLAQVESLAGMGMENNEEIADALGISIRTFYARKRDSAEFAEAIKRGKAKGKAFAISKLHERIKAGDLGAICFYLKCKCGWNEKIKIESNNVNTTKIFLFDGNEAQDAPKDS